MHHHKHSNLTEKLTPPKKQNFAESKLRITLRIFNSSNPAAHNIRQKRYGVRAKLLAKNRETATTRI
jgi:hypothetical protein